mgnify:CR=1 FL=1
MEKRRIKGTPHSEEVIGRIIQLCDEGMRSKDIYKQSKAMFGYTVKQSTISQILNKNGKSYTDEQVKKIKELFEFWAKLEYNNYQKNKEHEKCNNL